MVESKIYKIHFWVPKVYIRTKHIHEDTFFFKSIPDDICNLHIRTTLLHTLISKVFDEWFTYTSYSTNPKFILDPEARYFTHPPSYPQATIRVQPYIL
jgi:hypothetical protein